MTKPEIRFPTRAPELEINEADDGYIVYHPTRDRVHYLNQTAAVVFELCNGRNAEGELPELVRRLWDLPEQPVDAVADCIDLLRREGLVA